MNKFETLLESSIQRFTRGGLLVNDLVKFRSDYMKDEFFKNQASNYLEEVKKFVESGLNIRVSAIKPVYPNSFAPGNIQGEAESFLCDIVLEKAPGLYYSFITVPIRILEHIDTGVNLPPVPDQLKYKDKSSTDIEELKPFANSDTYMSPYRQTRTSDLGNAKDSKNNTFLNNKNIKIPSKSAEGEKSPAVTSYTYNYLPKKR